MGISECVSSMVCSYNSIFLIGFSMDSCLNGQCQSWGDVSNPRSFVLQEFFVA
jgi:hypothetical protein